MQLVVIYAQVKFTFHIIGNLAAYVNIECVISCILVGGSIMKFAEKVRAARLNIGYTQKQLAEITHVALRTIVNYEKGESYPCPWFTTFQCPSSDRATYQFHP